MKVALVGNQNCGKTTLFNLLTGMNQKVGNWPGVTVEKKSGIIKDTYFEVVDLPGVYSLFSYSEEEKITRNFILNEQVDLIVNVVDVCSIERGLYLTSQLMDVGIPFVVVLNMFDLLEKKQINVDVATLSEELGVKVIGVSALNNIGINELKESLFDVKINKKEIFCNRIESAIKAFNNTNNKRYFSIENIENNNCLNKYEEEIVDNLKSYYGEDIMEVIADQRYKFVENVKEKCFVCANKRESLSDKLDKIFLNKWLSLPIFSLIMAGIYYFCVGVVGSGSVNIVNCFINFISASIRSFLENIQVSGWLVSLIVDGIIVGVGSVLRFIPQLTILFLFISILETSGYMSRIAFFLDIIFKKLGLSGKTLIPFIVGSGCSVAGISTTRSIENKEEREMSIILTPFIPCSAKLPIIVLFSQFFFPDKMGIVSVSLYFLSIIVILILAIILKKYVYKEESNTFISELPEYKLPSVRYVIRDVFDKVISFVKRAGSVIFIASIFVWFSLSFSFDMKYGVSIENSLLAHFGKVVSWLFYPFLGKLSWEASVSSIQGLLAKEQVVASMTVISSIKNEILDGSLIFVSDAFSFFTPVSAYAYVAFNLFSAPCFGTIGAMRREFGNSKKVFLVVFLQCGFAWIVSFFIYLIGMLMWG